MSLEVCDRTELATSLWLKNLGSLERPWPVDSVVVNSTRRIQAIGKDKWNAERMNCPGYDGLVPIATVERRIGSKQKLTALRRSGYENCVEAKAKEPPFSTRQRQHRGRLIEGHDQAHGLKLRVHPVQEHDVTAPDISGPLIGRRGLKKALVESLR